jgi:hypothetical protein
MQKILFSSVKRLQTANNGASISHRDTSCKLLRRGYLSMVARAAPVEARPRGEAARTHSPLQEKRISNDRPALERLGPRTSYDATLGRLAELGLECQPECLGVGDPLESENHVTVRLVLPSAGHAYDVHSVLAQHIERAEEIV